MGYNVPHCALLTKHEIMPAEVVMNVRPQRLPAFAARTPETLEMPGAGILFVGVCTDL